MIIFFPLIYPIYLLNLNSSAEIKYVWALVRAEFEKHRNVRDLRVAKKLAQEGEDYLFENRHPAPKKFTFSPGGIMFEREHIHPDNMLDLWHPLEKAQYPYYFERREQLKKEFIQTWERKYPGHQTDAH